MSPVERQQDMPIAASSFAGMLKGVKRLSRLRTSGLLWVLLAMCIAAAIVSPAFLNPFNVINVLRQVALLPREVMNLGNFLVADPTRGIIDGDAPVVGRVLSGEHGIGLEKRDLMPLLFSAADLDAQARLRVIGPVVLNVAGHVVLSGTAGDPARAGWLTIRLASGGLTVTMKTRPPPASAWLACPSSSTSSPSRCAKAIRRRCSTPPMPSC